MRADTTVTDRRWQAGSARRPLVRRRRLLASIVGLAALLLAAQPAPGQTEAAWADVELGSGSFTAFTVPSPAITSCTFNPNVVGLLSSYTVVYTIPAGYTINYAYSSSAAFTSGPPRSPRRSASACSAGSSGPTSTSVLG
jgi:hypothetical protein